MFSFEYNFLFVLAAGAPAEARRRSGDHSPAGYAAAGSFLCGDQRGGPAELYARNVASYLIFLAESTGLAPADRCAAARRVLEDYATLDEFLGDIGR
jgi:hypothetical protein